MLIGSFLSKTGVNANYWLGTAKIVEEILPLNRAQVFAPLRFRG
ncbi:MAG: hypothetical protein RLP02_37055 [Coleofasciculus sp. C2-GNP5-27]